MSAINIAIAVYTQVGSKTSSGNNRQNVLSVTNVETTCYLQKQIPETARCLTRRFVVYGWLATCSSRYHVCSGYFFNGGGGGLGVCQVYCTRLR